MPQNNFNRVRLYLKPTFKSPWIVVGGLTILGALLRLYHLGDKSLWYDEAVLYWIAQGNFVEVVTQNATNNSAPPLFALLINLALNIGEAEIILRFLSWFAGVLAIPAIYLLSRQFLSRDVSYFCVFMVVIAQQQIKYSQQVREYSLAFLFAILMLYFFHQYLQISSWKNWGLLTLTWVLAIFLQYGLALLIIGLNFVFIFDLIGRTNQKRRLITWAISQIFVLSAAILVFQLSLKAQMQPGGFGATTYLEQAYWSGSLISLPKFAIENSVDIFHFAYPGTLFLFCLCLGLFVALREPNTRKIALMFILPTAITFLAAIARLYPYHGDRQIIFLTPMIYLTAGFGIGHLTRLDEKKIITVLLVLIIALSAIKSTTSESTHQYLAEAGRHHVRPIMTTLSSSLQPGDRIYIAYDGVPIFRYYYQGNTGQLIYGKYNRERPDMVRQEINELLSEPGRYWLFIAHCGYRCDVIPTAASSKRNVDLVKYAGGAWLYLAH